MDASDVATAFQRLSEIFEGFPGSASVSLPDELAAFLQSADIRLKFDGGDVTEIIVS